MAGATDRACIIGLDGAGFPVLDRWVAAGLMPNLARLMSRGARAELISAVPPVTGPAWTSLGTGVNPGVHGIFDFFKWDAGDGPRLVESGDIRVPWIWDMAAAGGRRVGVFNVPMTFPAPEVDGFLAAGLLAFRPGPQATHPPELYDELTSGGLTLIQTPPADGRDARLARDLVRTADESRRTLAYLLRRFRPDFLIAVLPELDILQHSLWGYCRPGGSERLKPAVRGLVRRLVRSIDSTIGLMVDSFGPAAALFVVSDHGFGPMTRRCRINRYLAHRGLLAPEEATGRAKRRGPLALLGLAPAVGALGIPRRLAALQQRLRPAAGDGANRQAHLFGHLARGVDWSRTRASFRSGAGCAIHINVRGRYPEGIVRPGAEREEVRREVIRALEALRDPASGRPLVSHVITREEAYSGPHVAEAPDVFFGLEGGRVGAVTGLDGPFLYASPGRGSHVMEGVFIASGPGVRPGEIGRAEILDVLPTVLSAMGLPVPEAAEGRVLGEAFRSESPARGASV